jgi:two-component system NtrC family sensor kinase
MLQAILDIALSSVPGAQRGSLMIREGEYLLYRAVRGYDLAQLQRVRFPVAGVGTAIPRGQRAIRVEGFIDWDATLLSAEANAILSQYGRLDDIQGSLITSIIVDGQFFGTLVLDNLHGHPPLPPEADMIAVLFAEQAGAVIEQAQLLERLRRTNTLLAEAEKLASLGRLIAGVAHEINNPLTAVLGHVELLKLEGLSSEARQSLDQIRGGADRVRTIVRNLQIFARQQYVGQSEVDLNDLVSQVLALKRIDFALDQIEVERELSERLPLTWGDAGLLSQVLLNLLGNAQYALRQRVPPRRVVVRTWVERPEADLDAPAGPQILVSVADNGPGVAPEVLQRIFEPFFTTKPVGQGTGLGLSVCYGIVADHGGQIWVASPHEPGATFVFNLPVRAAPANQAPSPAPAPALAPVRRRIMLIDDDDLVVELVRSALGAHNDLAIARDGRQALRLLREARFDVILCDLKMAGMSGSELYQALLDERPELLRQLLFISGDTSNPAAHDFLAQAGRPLLGKPFTLDELYRAIAALG